jgi:glycosyltransferase involved in cell wall biosynthesis
MIAFHYPPCFGSSGIHRTLSFSRELLNHNWEPLILTANKRAYPRILDASLEEIPQNVPVFRAFALDASRHLSFGGSYCKWMAIPDQWVSWWLGAVYLGLRVIRKYQPDVIWSTYPIPTAHLIGMTLSYLCRIPWIADFRDSMTEDNYPIDPTIRKTFQSIERMTVRRCQVAVFTTPGTRRMYAERFPSIPSSKWVITGNGYDEETFQAIEKTFIGASPCNRPLVLVHSGILYLSERNPLPFFSSLADLKQRGMISQANLKIILRASGNEEFYRSHVQSIGIDNIVTFEEAIPYQNALWEMLNCDGLLLFQGSNCNHQIPAKLYEYLRAGRPILALTDPSGDTAHVLTKAGIQTIVPLDSKEQIMRGLLEFLSLIREGHAPIPIKEEVIRHSRQARGKEFAKLLDSIVD